MSFADDLARICTKAGDKVELLVRKVAIDLGKAVVEKSPVGDPLNWLSLNPSVDTKTGKQSTARKAPAGYVGGTFKGNWQYGTNSINATVDSPADKSGGGSNTRIAAGVSAWVPGQTIYMTNSLPYAQKLEHGWSKQAPVGMVKTTVAEFQESVRKAAESLK